MAEYLSERELRAIQRSRARERQLQDEQEERSFRLTLNQERRNEGKHSESNRDFSIAKELQNTKVQDSNRVNSPIERNFNEILEKRSRVNRKDRRRVYDTTNIEKYINSDTDSELSNPNTIDDFFHEITTNDIREMEKLRCETEEQANVRDKETRRNTIDSHLEFIDERIERLDCTLREFEQDGIERRNSDKDAEISCKESIERSVYKEIGKYQTLNSGTKYKHLKKDHGVIRDYTTKLKDEKSKEFTMDFDTKLENVRKEGYEIKSQSSRYEKERLKLRRLQLEEERKEELMREKERNLQKEIESKKKAEKELLERITLLENEETALNKRRNDNERLEREMELMSHENDAMSQKIELLKEKERVLKLKMQKRIKDCGSEIESKNGRDFYCDSEIELNDGGDSLKQHRRKSTIHEVGTYRYPAFKLGPPKIPPFDGTQFENWKMEVTCLMRTNMYPDYAIVQAIRNSLKDETRQVLLTLQATASSKDIVEKLNEIYGDLKNEDTVVQDFYSAKQKKGEPISVWGVRVETLFQKAVDKGEIHESKRNRKLKERFWRGLRSEKLRLATRVSYESTDTFEKLRRKARQEEEDIEVESEKPEQAKVNVLQETKIDEKLGILQELLERMKTMEIDIGKLKDKRNSYNQSNYNQRRPFRGGYRNRRGDYRNQDTTHERYGDRNKKENYENNQKSQDQKEQFTKDGRKFSANVDLNGRKLPPEGSMEASQ